MPLTGRCLCGVVRYELDAEVRAIVNCHCQYCRRAHGAAFVTTAPVPSDALRIVAGEQQVTRYEGRFFCGACATRLFNRADAIPETTVLIVARSIASRSSCSRSASTSAASTSLCSTLVTT